MVDDADASSFRLQLSETPGSATYRRLGEQHLPNQAQDVRMLRQLGLRHPLLHEPVLLEDLPVPALLFSHNLRKRLQVLSIGPWYHILASGDDD
jgi:hypothetical protein